MNKDSVYTWHHHMLLVRLSISYITYSGYENVCTSPHMFWLVALATHHHHLRHGMQANWQQHVQTTQYYIHTMTLSFLIRLPVQMWNVSLTIKSSLSTNNLLQDFQQLCSEYFMPTQVRRHSSTFPCLQKFNQVFNIFRSCCYKKQTWWLYIPLTTPPQCQGIAVFKMLC